ncbi:DUF3265 domain-containing protein [Vibrio vulnificus]|nr:DUF3265 domain-containing protein [Vibrio vulnificus]
MAFLVCVSFGGESGLRKVDLGGTHPLTQRYVLGGKNGIFSVLWNRLGCNGTYVSCYLANWK